MDDIMLDARGPHNTLIDKLTAALGHLNTVDVGIDEFSQNLLDAKHEISSLTSTVSTIQRVSATKSRGILVKLDIGCANLSVEIMKIRDILDAAIHELQARGIEFVDAKERIDDLEQTVAQQFDLIMNLNQTNESLVDSIAARQVDLRELRKRLSSAPSSPCPDVLMPDALDSAEKSDKSHDKVELSGVDFRLSAVRMFSRSLLCPSSTPRSLPLLAYMTKRMPINERRTRALDELKAPSRLHSLVALPAMSDDEEDSDGSSDEDAPATHRKVLATPYRSGDVDIFLRFLDTAAATSHFGDLHREVPPIAERKPSLFDSVPKNMPIQLYDATWFNAQSKEDRISLNPELSVVMVPASTDFFSRSGEHRWSVTKLTAKYGRKVFALYDLDFLADARPAQDRGVPFKAPSTEESDSSDSSPESDSGDSDTGSDRSRVDELSELSQSDA
uniref:Uncharacterized protein n=1 Tax=Mycena chlorophos TaxID=658473 RepID=A0ABQ0KUH8_MYCCL|nr:predicted protein [Mycena chlorophos]